jgi:nitroreductase
MNDLPSVPADARRAVDDAITTRRSIRAFLPTPMPEAAISDILDVASRAPIDEFTKFHS